MVKLFISEITGSVLENPVPDKNKISCLFLSVPTYLSNVMLSTTQTLAQIKSQERTGYVKQYFMTSITWIRVGSAC